MHVLEIGCAPGKQLAYIGKRLRARVAGMDYSQNGIALSRRLFDRLGIDCDLRCEDIFATSFPPGSFDLVYSVGVIEHFDDPSPIVKRHMELVRPGGIGLMLVPNYYGVYGRLQRYLDPGNLGMHNIAIMTPEGMKKLAPRCLSHRAEAYLHGRMSPWLLNMENRLPAAIARLASYGLNFIGLMQPFDVKAVCPVVVLKVIRK